MLEIRKSWTGALQNLPTAIDANEKTFLAFMIRIPRISGISYRTVALDHRTPLHRGETFTTDYGRMVEEALSYGIGRLVEAALKLNLSGNPIGICC